MAKNKSSSKARKARLTAYKAESRSLRNRTRKLEAHIKRHPDDAKAVSSLKKGLVVYGRKKPYNNKLWSPEKIIYAHQIRLYAGENGHNVLNKPKAFDQNRKAA